MKLKVGQLLRLKRNYPSLDLQEGDFAILTEIDWDFRDYPASINGNTGRGFFFFPNKSNPEGRKELGYMLLYEMFEELEGDSGEGLRLEV